jgi:hypothetical protein
MAKIGIAALAINSDTVGKARMRNEDIWTGSDRMRHNLSIIVVNS